MKRSLVCFDSVVKNFSVFAEASILDNQLMLEYWIDGAVGDILFPQGSKAPSRKDELWQTTCFEAFWAIAGKKAYWELNLSPSLDWNVYSFSGYRADQKPENRIKLEATKLANRFKTSVDLSKLGLKASEEIDLGLSAVIETKTVGNTYWALTHKGLKPDFHLRKSFIC